jgi:hypothetical protein
MRNLIRTAVLLALLGSRTTIAQTIGSAASSAGSASATAASSLTQNRLIGDAPVGHRQPHASDISSQNASDIEHIGEEDAGVDRKLNILPRLLRLAADCHGFS